MAGTINKFKVEIDGDEIVDPVDQRIVFVSVQDNLNLPDMFIIHFKDPDRSVLATTKAQIGSAVKISVVSDASPGGEKLIVGEVTALEAQFSHSDTITVVRGFDHSHRLYRGRRTRSFKGKLYSDVAKAVASGAGLDLGQIDATTGVIDFVSQPNVSDWVFLKDIEAKTGFRAFVADGKFEFRKPIEAADASAPATDFVQPPEPTQLVFGQNLHRGVNIVSSAEQVAKVQVRGWDIDAKEGLVEESEAKTTTAEIGVTPIEIAKKFGNGVLVSSSVPYGKRAEAAAAAKALAEQVADGHAEFMAEVDGNAKLKAGAEFSLGNAGLPFDGKYVITASEHQYHPSTGYVTAVTVSGRQVRSLFELAGGGENIGDGKIYGVVSALVDDVKDPEKMARVRLKFPWMSADYVSPWARTMQLGAGPTRGSFFVSEVGDEVLVAFEHGDFSRPYVIGGLYNGKDKLGLQDGFVGSDGKLTSRGFRSRNGHRIAFLDGFQNKQQLALTTGDGKNEIRLEQSGTKVVVHSNGTVEITGGNEVKVSSKKVVVHSETDLNLDAKNINLSATGEVSMKSSGRFVVKGTTIELN
jgi:uncharacterized protein involved in type VI secretion and phage assembly